MTNTSEMPRASSLLSLYFRLMRLVMVPDVLVYSRGDLSVLSAAGGALFYYSQPCTNMPALADNSAAE
jgi:hypothetical protein